MSHCHHHTTTTAPFPPPPPLRRPALPSALELLGLRCREGTRYDVTKSPEHGQCQGRCGRDTMEGGPIEFPGPRACLLRDPWQRASE